MFNFANLSIKIWYRTVLCFTSPEGGMSQKIKGIKSFLWFEHQRYWTASRKYRKDGLSNYNHSPASCLGTVLSVISDCFRFVLKFMRVDSPCPGYRLIFTDLQQTGWLGGGVHASCTDAESKEMLILAKIQPRTKNKQRKCPCCSLSQIKLCRRNRLQQDSEATNKNCVVSQTHPNLLGFKHIFQSNKQHLVFWHEKGYQW